MPKVKILLLCILPSAHHNHVIHQTNKLLALKEDKSTVFYLDLTSHFEISPEHINNSLYLSDKIHPNKEGYTIWYKVMEPLFSKLIA